MIVAVFFFALGATLLALAIPRGVAAIIVATQQTTSADLFAGKHPPVPALIAGANTYERALRWVRSPQYFSNLSAVEFELAANYPIGSTDRKTWTERAEQHAAAALERNPADGYTWVRLAIIRQARYAPPEEIVAPLITSLDVSPNRRDLWRSRMSLLLYHWSALTPAELPSVRHQIRTLWSIPSERFFLYDSAFRYRQTGNLQSALNDEPGAIEELRLFDRQMSFP